MVLKTGSTIRIPLSAIKPIAVEQKISHIIDAGLFGKIVTLSLERTIYPRGVVGFRMRVGLPEQDKASTAQMLFNYLNGKKISYSRSYFRTENLSLLISESKEREFEGLLRSESLSKRDTGFTY
ncbi:MAG: hypothetical protein HRU09_18385 [Oligoflexales bacterium]|nr:hypothetical protein [Oligoflexales bacterium]